MLQVFFNENRFQIIWTNNTPLTTTITHRLWFDYKINLRTQLYRNTDGSIDMYVPMILMYKVCLTAV